MHNNKWSADRISILRCPVCAHSKMSMQDERHMQCGHCQSLFDFSDNVVDLFEVSSAHEEALKFTGLNGKDYHEARKQIGTVKYSLIRRAEAITEALTGLGRGQGERLLEVGCADGMMGDMLSKTLTYREIVGLDLLDKWLPYSPNLAVRGDCQEMPFDDGSFDSVVAAALIEHLPQPDLFVSECLRVLRPGGCLVLTCPDPVYDWICTKTGYFKYACHLHRFSIKDIISKLETAGFTKCGGKKFMLAPLKCSPLESMEKLSLFQGPLRFLLMNQVIWGIK